MPVLGRLGELRATVLRERIDLFVLGSAVAARGVRRAHRDVPGPRPAAQRAVRVLRGRLRAHPTAEINAAWFAHLVDAHAHHPSPMVKRVLDVVTSVALGVVTLPLMGLLAVLVRLDGGPAIYSQERVGEGGEPFRIYKLRTMGWARETGRMGERGRPARHRRRPLPAPTHLDELPQLWNVLRGEMSFVGPRPEQLEFVERLEARCPSTGAATSSGRA